MGGGRRDRDGVTDVRGRLREPDGLCRLLPTWDGWQKPQGQSRRPSTPSDIVTTGGDRAEPLCTAQRMGAAAVARRSYPAVTPRSACDIPAIWNARRELGDPARLRPPSCVKGKAENGGGRDRSTADYERLVKAG